MLDQASLKQDPSGVICEFSAASMGKTGLRQHAGNGKLLDCRKGKKTSVQKMFNREEDVIKAELKWTLADNNYII